MQDSRRVNRVYKQYLSFLQKRRLLFILTSELPRLLSAHSISLRLSIKRTKVGCIPSTSIKQREKQKQISIHLERSILESTEKANQ